MTKNLSAAVVYMLAFQVAVPSLVWAQARPGSTGNSTGTGSSGVPINLDLSSKNRNLTATNLGSSGQVDIKVGSQMMTVNASTLLTPAERLAVFQVLSTGQQSILLGSLGNAIGGSFNIGSKFNQYASGLVIPGGVTAIQNAAVNNSLNLTGNLVNAGNYLGVSTSQSYTNLLLGAANIYNNPGGHISTVLPAGGLAGYSNAISNVNLTLSALNNIVNSGSITSSGNLNLVAGNSVINALPPGTTGSAPVLQAVGDVNFNAGQIVNSGLISSLTGNVNFATQAQQSLLVDNGGGAIKALLGNINVRDPQFSGKYDVNLAGGDWLSKQLNVNSGDGAVRLNVGKLTGALNVTGGTAHVVADTSSLVLGTMNLSGDPLFSGTGDVTISTPMTFPGVDLAIVAGGNILTSATAVSLDTHSNGVGGSITLVAGANFVVNGLPANEDITITGASASGGKIDLLTKAPASFSINSSGVSGDAGNIQFIAFSGKADASGSITIPSTVPISANSTSGKAGNITFIAGGAGAIPNTSAKLSISGGYTQSGSSVTLNSIGTISAVGSAGSGDITLSTSQPVVSNGGVNILQGTIKSGNFSTSTPVASKSGRVTLGTVTGSGKLTVTAGDSILFRNAVKVDGDATVNATANNGGITFTNNFVSGGNVTLGANGAGTISTPNQYLTSVAGGGNYQMGVAASPDGTVVVMPNFSSNNVNIINTANNSSTIISLTGTINSGPRGAVISPDNKFAYIVGLDVQGANRTGKVIVIDLSSKSVSTTYNFTATGTPSTFDPQLIAVSQNTGKIYVLSAFNGQQDAQVTVIDPLNPLSPQNIVVTGSKGGASGNSNLAGGIAVNAQGTLAYIASPASNNIAVLDLKTNTVMSTISLSSVSPNSFGPVSIAFNTTGTRIFVGENVVFAKSGKILTIDAVPSSPNFNKVISSSLTFSATSASAGFFPQALTMNPTNTSLIVEPTYLELQTTFNPLTLQNVDNTGIGTSLAPDNYGSNTFSTIVNNNGVRNIRTYIACPTHTNPLSGTMAIIQSPTIMAKNLTMSSGTGQISANYDVQGGTMKVNTGGSVILSNVGSAASTVGASSAGTGGSVFQLGSVAGLSITGNITAGGLINISANTGGIALGANIGSAATSSVTLEAAGTGSITQTAGLLSGKVINLFATGGGSIGVNSGSRVKTATNSLNYFATTPTGNIYLQNTGTLTLNSINMEGTFDLVNTGAITSKQLISAGNVSLITSSGSSAITLAGITAPDAGTINLQTSGSGAISSTGQLKALAGITLTSASGSIGSSAKPLSLHTSNLTALTSGSGSVYLTDDVAITSMGASGGQTFQLSANGDITTSAISGKTINLSVTAANGAVTLGGNIGASTSTVTIKAAGTGKVLQTSGTLAASSLTVTTGSGDIDLSAAANNVAKFSLSSSAGGAIKLDNTGSSATGSQTLSLAKGSSVDINTAGNLIIAGSVGQGGASTVTLQSGGSITQSASTASVTAGSVSLDAVGGVGTSTAPIKTVTSKIIALGSTAAGKLGVYISNTGDLDILGVTGQTVSLTSTGAITQNTLPTNLIEANTLILKSGTNFDIGASGSPLHATGVGGAFNPSTVNLTVTSGGDTYFSAGSGSQSSLVTLNFTGKSTAAGSKGFSIATEISGASAPGAITFASGASMVASNPSAQVVLSTVNGTSGASITQAKTGTSIFAPSAVISGGNIGTLSIPLGVSALKATDSLTLQSTNTVASSTYLNAASNVILSGASSSSKDFNLSSTGNISMSSTGSFNAAQSMTVTAKGSITQDIASAGFSALFATLSSGAGGTGTLAIPVVVNSKSGSILNLTATSAGNVFLKAPSSGVGESLSLAASNAKGSLGFNLQSVNTVTLVQAAVAGVTAPSVSIQVSGAGQSILESGAGVGISGTTVNLKAGAGGTIGDTSPVNVVGSTVKLTANADSVNLGSTSGIINLVGNNTATAALGTGFKLNAAGNIVIAAGASVSGPVVNLSTSKGTVTQVDVGTSTISAGQVILSGTSIGTASTKTVVFSSNSASPVQATLNATTGAAYVTVGGSGGVDFTGTSNIKTIASVTTNGVNAPINFKSGATLTAGTSVALSSTGGITQSASSATIISPIINLSDSSASGIGSVGQGIVVSNVVGKTTPITLTVNDTSSAFLNSNSSVNIAPSKVGAVALSNFTLVSAGTITVTGPLTSGDFVSLSTTGAGANILTSGSGLITGTISLSSAHGSIGTTAAPLKVNTTSLVSTNAPEGTVAISNSNTSTLGINGNSTAKNGYSVTTAGPLVINSNVSTSGAVSGSKLGNINLVGKGNVVVSANVTSEEGSIKIQDTDAANGSITVSDNKNIKSHLAVNTGTTAGQVSLIVGPSTSTANQSPPYNPGNSFVLNANGGKIYFGANPTGVKVSSGQATINAINQNVFFNTSTPTGKITLGNGVIVEADPPPLVPTIASPASSASASAQSLQLGSIATPSAIVGSVAPIANIASGFVPLAQASMPVPTDLTASRISALGNRSVGFAHGDRDSVGEMSLGEMATLDGTGIHSSQGVFAGVAVINSANSNSISAESLRGSVSQGIAPSSFALSEGQILLAPSKDISVHTPSGTVRVDKGAIALLLVTPETTSIYNLHDGHRNSVSITSERQTINLLLGEHASLSSRNGDFADVNLLAEVSHADLKSQKLANNTSLHRSKFSLTSLLGSGVLSNLKQADNSTEKRVTARLHKNAAIMMQFRLPSSPYVKMQSKSVGRIAQKKAPVTLLAEK